VTGAFAAAALTGIQVGAAMVASAAVVAEVGAGRLALLRYGVALGLLLPLAALRRSAAIDRRDLLPILLLGMGQFGLLIALLNWAVLLTDPARVSLVFATLPLMTLAIGSGLGRAALRPVELLAIVATLVGITLLFASEALLRGLVPRDLLGLAAAAGATLVGALCAVWYRPYLQRHGVVKVSALAMSASLPPLALLALLEPQAVPMAAWSARTVALVGFVGLSSGVGYLLWLHALRHAHASQVTAFLGLGPVTALALTAAGDGTPITPQLIGGTLLVVIGLAVIAFSARTAARPG
jgi:drug/metabolite transporter (DMT)-like permease